jgi:hypothetical protein
MSWATTSASTKIKSPAWASSKSATRTSRQTGSYRPASNATRCAPSSPLASRIQEINRLATPPCTHIAPNPAITTRSKSRFQTPRITGASAPAITTGCRVNCSGRYGTPAVEYS